MTIEAMKQALEALEHVHRTGDTQVFDICYADHVIPALRAAIEQAQDPVAWMTHSNDMIPLFHKTRAAALNWQTQPTPLYTAPRQWQGLTDEEFQAIAIKYALPTPTGLMYFKDEIEAKLKEKNR